MALEAAAATSASSSSFSAVSAASAAAAARARAHEAAVAAAAAATVGVLLAFPSASAASAGSPDAFGCYFLIVAPALLRVRWLPAALALAAPAAAAASTFSLLPTCHARRALAAAWAIGALMAYVVDSLRRAAFASARLAAAAAEQEAAAARAREKAARDLAAATAARTLAVAKARAAAAAGTEFMSLLCHEVRTPLNGVLAANEMLLLLPDEELSAEARELASTIRVSGALLLNTVSSFLDHFKTAAVRRERERGRLFFVFGVFCFSLREGRENKAQHAFFLSLFDRLPPPPPKKKTGPPTRRRAQQSHPPRPHRGCLLRGRRDASGPRDGRGRCRRRQRGVGGEKRRSKGGFRGCCCCCRCCFEAAPAAADAARDLAPAADLEGRPF